MNHFAEPRRRFRLVRVAFAANLTFALGIALDCRHLTVAAQTATHRSVAGAARLVGQGRFDTAERQLWDVLAQEPENTGAISLLGNIRVRQERFSEAEALFKRALVIDPKLTAGYRNLGRLYELQERREDAKSAYQTVLKLNPGDIEANIALGGLYSQSGEFEKSLAILNGIPAGKRPPSVLPLLAVDYFALHQPDKVVPLVHLARGGAISDPAILPRFARVLLDNGYVDDAEHLLQSQTPAHRTDSDYLLAWARVQEHQDNVEAARRTLAQAARFYPALFDAPFQSARLASQLKDYRQEVSWLEKALQIKPDESEALRHLALAQMRVGEAASAVATAKRLYELRPSDPDVMYLLISTLANHSEWHEARPVAARLVATRNDSTSHVALAMTLLNDGDIEGAAAQVDEALRQNPKDSEAHYYRGVIDRQKGNLNGALQELQLVTESNPQHGLAQAELGIVTMQLGRLDQARTAFESAVSIHPEVPENHYQLGLVYGRLGMAEKARAQMAEFQKLKDEADRRRSTGTKANAQPAGEKPSF